MLSLEKAYERVREEFQVVAKMGAYACIDSAMVSVDALLEAATPGHSQYIGKTLADVPDGTVAVVVRGGLPLAVRMKQGDGAYVVGSALKQENFERTAISCEILHIIKLGEPKPVTLADELRDCCDRMERARDLLKDRGSWNMLDTAKAREALAREEQNQSA